MTKKFQIYFVAVFVFLLSVNISYSGIDINKWEVFTDLKNVVGISVLDNKYGFFATSGGMYSVDLTNGNVLNKFTNIDGLLNTDLTTVIADNQKRIWIGASDGSLCIYDYYSGTWKYIYDIRNSNENNKSINSFAIYNNFIFVATSYGIHKISLLNLNFVDAPYYQFGTMPNRTRVNNIVISNNKIYAATVSGVAYANLVNTNLNNPASWSVYNTPPLGANVQAVEVFNGNIFAGSAYGFSYFNGTDWNLYPNPQVNTSNIKSIKAIGNSIYFISNSNIYYADSNNLANITTFLTTGNYNYLYSDNQNPIVGSYEGGAYIKKGNNYETVFPNCPYRNSFDYVTFDNAGILYATAGTGDGGFYKFDGTTWTSYTRSVYPLLGSDLFKKVIPGNNFYWVTGFGGGPTYVSGEIMKNFNTHNSNLPGISGDSNFCTPIAGAIDSKGKFWVSFFQSNSGANLYSYKGDSIWNIYYNPSLIGARFTNFAIDNYDTKWVVALTPPGVYFYNENGTDSIYNDDIYGLYPTGELASVNSISDVIVDKNNEVWIATDNGVFIISNPYLAIQDPNNKPAPVKLGIISGNLRVPFTENCICIYSDVLNEKWIGTQSNGVFHLSSDGSTLIEQFNKTNSPLLENRVSSITVNRKSGKAYFGTLRGLISYQTFAVEAVNEFDKIICMPNPYLIPSNVDVKIDGLVENSTVKIITLSGEVVNEFESPGGRIATWNGLNKKGQLVPTGVYIIVAFDKNASKVGKGKLAVIRK